MQSTNLKQALDQELNLKPSRSTNNCQSYECKPIDLNGHFKPSPPFLIAAKVLANASAGWQRLKVLSGGSYTLWPQL